MTTQAGPAWAKGYDVARLKEYGQLYKDHAGQYLYGAFSRLSELDCVEALQRGQLYLKTTEGGALGALMVAQQLTRDSKLKDFTGAQRAVARVGDWRITRLAWREGYSDLARQLVQAVIGEAMSPTTDTLFDSDPGARAPRVWLRLLREHPGERDIAAWLQARHVCTQIPASSELWGWYCYGPEPEVVAADPAEHAGLAYLREAPQAQVQLALAAVLLEGLAWEAHYSSKQRKGAWSGLALRGYGPGEGEEPYSPETIHKPSEMSQKWKREHAEQLDWGIGDTPLRARLPELEPLIALVPGEHHRIRLLRLAPGGGELTRHADITDPDAGVRDGLVSRLHIPLKTHPRVQFSQWLLDGREQLAHMPAGQVWYLDTRKPHRALNESTDERIHLVIDTESGPELRELLRQAWEWPA